MTAGPHGNPEHYLGRVAHLVQTLRHRAAEAGHTWADDGPWPVVLLTCPKGHPLRHVRLGTASRGGEPAAALIVVGRDGRHRPILDRGDPPWDVGPSHEQDTCLAPGCDRSVYRPRGYCDEHGGHAVEQLDPFKSRFVCPLASHRWEADLPADAVLRAYGAAALLGLDRVPVTATAPSTRR